MCNSLIETVQIGGIGASRNNMFFSERTKFWCLAMLSYLGNGCGLHSDAAAAFLKRPKGRGRKRINFLSLEAVERKSRLKSFGFVSIKKEQEKYVIWIPKGVLFFECFCFEIFDKKWVRKISTSRSCTAAAKRTRGPS